MTPPTVRIAVAGPWHEYDRERLRALIGRLPVIVPGSRPVPCVGCGVLLAVGPRTFATMAADPLIPLVCPVCVVHAVEPGDETEIVSLGNPDSRLEGDA